MKFKKSIATAGLVVIAAIGLAACGTQSAQQKANISDVQASAQALNHLQIVQPTPLFPWSQVRQTQIAIETAQADTTQTTTFFFNQGVADPISTCPSIGVPVASTTELTNPQQVTPSSGRNASQVIAQADPTGVYPGNSTGTYVVCVSPDGKNYIQYWEGFVDSVTGPAVWNTTTHSVQMTGPSTAAVKTRPSA
jgi:hypothetical protein